MVTLSRVSDFLCRYRRLYGGSPVYVELSESELRSLRRECEGTHCIGAYGSTILGVPVRLAE
jgi:hypothetical protein